MKRIFLFLISFNFIISYPFFPTILTLSLPSKDKKSFRVENTFARWIQAAGGDLIIVHHWTKKEDLENLIKNKINGVLFQGNPEDINLNSDYSKQVKIIYDLVTQNYKENSKIPIYAFGNDMILIGLLGSGKENITYGKLILNTPNFISIKKEDSLVFEEFQKRDIEAIQKKEICPNHLTHYINQTSYDQTLKDTFDIIATANSSNIEYISIIQHKTYPIIGISFHPEYVSFEQNTKYNIPQNLNSVLVARLIANAFVFYGRENCPNKLTIEEKRDNKGVFDFIDPYEMFPKLFEDRYQFVYVKK